MIKRGKGTKEQQGKVFNCCNNCILESIEVVNVLRNMNSIELLERNLVQLEKVKEMQRLCFLPRAKGSELSHRLHELMVEAGILLEYFGPDHTINEEARQKRWERRLAKRKRGKPNNDSGRLVSLVENIPTKMMQERKSCHKNSWDRVVWQKESNASYSPEWKRRMTQCSSRPSSPGLSQSSFSTQNVQRKRMRDSATVDNMHPYKRENIEHVDSQVSITTTDNVTWISNNDVSWRHNQTLYTDSFDPSQVTEEPSERNRVNLMLGRYGYPPSSSIQGDMIGFSDEKERIWMFSTTEPECREERMASNTFHYSDKREMRDTHKLAQFKSGEEEDFVVTNDELYRLGEEWPSPFLQPTQVDQTFSHSSPSLEPLSNNPLWNGSFHYEWPEDMLYASSESSSDWFIKTLALEDTHGMRSWKEMDSGVAQVEEIEKQSWPSEWIREEEEEILLNWTLP
ncbi:hypothetical protein Gasu2_07330 [Galdieria sulphuraria]|nr:hypothetical protein Gasu2_07330 [Galdieria sulphuraria]